MDANKRRVLQSIGYEINPCCGLCAHGQFVNPHSDFGVCKVNKYEHLKHGDTRDLSVNRYGRCQVVGEFVFDPFAAAVLDTWDQFFQDDEDCSNDPS